MESSVIIGWIQGVISILTIVYAPIVALKIQKKTENCKEAHSRKLQIFKILLATQAYGTSVQYVEALNMKETINAQLSQETIRIDS